MIVPPDETLPDGQGEICQTISSAWIGICVKSEDCAQGFAGSAQDAPQHETDAHLPAPAAGSRQQDKTNCDAQLGTCVKSEDCAQGVWSRGTCVKSEDCAQGDWSVASSAEDARLGTCVEPEKSKSEDCAQGDWSVASSAEDARLRPCVEPKKSKQIRRGTVTAAQARDINRAKKFDTLATRPLEQPGSMDTELLGLWWTVAK